MTSPPLVEICVDDLAGALAAEAEGADRIELCAALSEGGITPSIGLVRAVLARLRRVDVMVMLRPRGGDFTVSPEELSVMLADLAALKAEPRHVGLGIVFGALRSSGEIDTETTALLRREAGDLPVTFHKAFDATPDLPTSLETLARLGIDRVLTSGGAATAVEGAAMLRRLQRQAAWRIAILAGGGVRAANAPALLAETGVAEIHLRAMRPDARGRPVTSGAEIAAVLEAVGKRA